MGEGGWGETGEQKIATGVSEIAVARSPLLSPLLGTAKLCQPLNLRLRTEFRDSRNFAGPVSHDAGSRHVELRTTATVKIER